MCVYLEYQILYILFSVVVKSHDLHVDVIFDDERFTFHQCSM